MMATRLFREIDRRMKALNLDPTTLAKKAGLGESYIRDLERKESAEPRRSKLEKVAKVLGCSVEDLTGERPVRVSQLKTDTVTINELDVHVAAGRGVGDDAGGLMAAHESSAVIGVHTYPADSFREAYGINPGRVRIIPVRGTSMEPELWAGQRVMVDIEDKAPSPPGIFVVWDGLGLVLKYVEVVANSEPLRVRISSAHHAFKPYERNLDEAYINGRVIGVWKRM
jgi:phage repressor protein C with HTH and peptisase S24 domain